MRTATLAACLPLLWLMTAAAGCGGGSTKPETCTDDEKNQNETDVDCGGVCAPCANGLRCLMDADCASGECQNGLCVIPSETCDIGATRCNAAGNLETCADPGDHWDETTCDHGCQVVSGAAECIAGPEGVLPSHLKQTAGSGRASSANYRAAVRAGAPVPTGSASAAGKRVAGGSPAAP